MNAYLSSYRLQLYFLFRMEPILKGLTALATSSLKQFIGPFRDQWSRVSFLIPGNVAGFTSLQTSIFHSQASQPLSEFLCQRAILQSPAPVTFRHSGKIHPRLRPQLQKVLCWNDGGVGLRCECRTDHGPDNFPVIASQLFLQRFALRGWQLSIPARRCVVIMGSGIDNCLQRVRFWWN